MDSNVVPITLEPVAEPIYVTFDGVLHVLVAKHPSGPYIVACGAHGALGGAGDWVTLCRECVQGA